ncbi:hypothetical protein [Snodgrassella communis]|uniref:hypothetical protein n=1 Tax=Snodgrassella communis TaxID=2946699 RepID=UPI002147CD19|nr:hypothetical protein [Snodgrassella communis]
MNWSPYGIWNPSICQLHYAILIQFGYQACAAVDIVGGLAVYGFADTPAKRVVLVAGYFSCVVADSAQAFGCVVAVAEFFIATFFCGQLTIGSIG